MLSLRKIFSLFVVLSFLICIPLTQADEWSNVKAGAMSYVSSYSSLGIFFYGNAGESVTFVPYSDRTSVFCGISDINSGGAGIFRTCGDYGFTTTLPYSTLYLIACVKDGGSSDDVLGAVFSNGYRRDIMKSPSIKKPEIVNFEMKARVAETMDQMLNSEK